MQDRARSSQICRDYRPLTGRAPAASTSNLPSTLRDHLYSPPGMRMSCCGCLSQRLHSVPSIQMPDTRKGLHLLLHYVLLPTDSALYLLANCILTWFGFFDITETVKSKRVDSLYRLRRPCINLETTPTRPTASRIFQFNRDSRSCTIITQG